jgi:hypothetical protein
MGRFSTVALLLLAACGDDLRGPDDVGGDDELGFHDQIADGVSNPTQRLVPQVCGVQTWSTNIVSSMNVSVAMRGQTSTVLATPDGGGTIAGFVVDPATHTLTTQKLGINGKFSSVTTSLISSGVAAASVADSTIMVHTLDADLSNQQYIGKVAGRYLAEPALWPAQGDYVMPTAGDDGVWMHWFGSTLTPLGSKQLIQTAPVTSFDATMFGNTMLATWSTSDSCYVVSANVFDHNGTTARLPSACGQPRVAVNNWGIGLAVFDTAEGASMMTLGPSQMGGNIRVLRNGMTSPRAVFDGQSFWISFVDDRNDVVVGLVDETYNVRLMAMNGPQVTSAGYELVMGDGSPWVVSLSGGIYTAYRLCLGVEEASLTTR